MIPKDFEKMGKHIWDAAINAHRDGSRETIVPIRLQDDGICRVTVSPPTYVESRLEIENGEPRTQWRHGSKLSDGTIKWGEWS